MKHKILLPFLLLLITISCVENIETIDPDSNSNDSDLINVNVPSSFNFETTTEVEVDIDVKSNSGLPLSGVKVSFYTDNPDFGGNYLTSLFTNSEGKLNSKIKLPTYLQEIFIQVNSLGFANQKSQSVTPYMSIEFGGLINQERSSFTNKSSTTRIPISGNYYYIGQFSTGLNEGLPNYLEPTPDVITQNFLDDVNASLPSSQSVPINNPQYLATSNQLDVVVVDKSDVWVTFIGESASFRNTLGYYVHDTNNPPSDVSQIDSVFVVLPNASLLNSNGQLNPGDKVKIGTFDAGKTISWVLFRNAWNGTDVNVNATKFYSRNDFNTMEDPDKRQHSVQLVDIANQLLLNGFEDQVRSNGSSDEDFNDLLFYVSANPWDGIDSGDVPSVTPDEDTDGDGISDDNDDFPNDPDRALRNTYIGTLAYEDLWPSKGDYDFNDMVIDYDIDHILNSSNSLVDIEADWTVKAVGAGFDNGFGIEIDGLSPNAIASVTGQDLQENIIGASFNGVEPGQSNATIIFFDNVDNIIQSAGGSFINTIPANPYVTPVTLNSVINFTTPVDESLTGLPPYDPFIFVNGNRGREVHLPGETPTSLADLSLFGTSSDATDPATNYYYKTENGLPWAIHIPETFDYPIEYIPINEAYTNFVQWAESGGTLNTDWYLDLPGYRDETKIYD
jgi:LruC domain-containing protein